MIHDKNMPRYARIKEIIRARIFEGTYVDRLPSEHSMAKEFGISYMTVRRAIGELIEDGFVFRAQGTGTFVATRGTVKGDTGAIMLSLPRTVTGRLSNPYYSEIICGMEKAAHQKGYSLLISVGVDEEISKIHENGRFMPIRADGLIMPVALNISDELKLMSRYTPVVFLGDWQYENPGLPYVCVDTCNGFHMLTDYLAGLGHRRIAVALHKDVKKGRMKGYLDSLKENAIEPLDELMLIVDETFEGGLEAAEHFISMDKPPTAIIGHNDLVALGIMTRLLDRGFKVPEDISVAGFDNIAESGRCRPGLTTVNVPKEEIGEKAVDMIISMMSSNRDDDIVMAHKFPASLVIRDSTGKCNKRR